MEYDPVDKVFIFYGEDFNTWAYCYSRTPASTNAIQESIEAPLIRIISRASQGEIMIRLTTPVRISVVNAELFNALGESQRISLRANWGYFVIQTDRHLRRGIYILRVSIGNNFIVHKFIIG